MTEIQPGVRRRKESPTRGEEVTLLVGYEAPSSDVAVEWVRGAGGIVEDRLPYDTLAVRISESDLDSLCSIDGVTSVEIEGKWEQMNEGNSDSHRGSIR